MKTITKRVILTYKDTEYLDYILNTEPSCDEECFGEDSTFRVTIPFPNGVEMDIKCCGVQFEEDGISNLPWTEAVLFQNGAECECTEPCEDFFDEWEFELDGVRYVGIVVRGVRPFSSTLNVFSDPVVTYDGVFCEKHCDDGLTPKEIEAMQSKLNGDEACPMEIEAKEHENIAMGFLTPEASASLTKEDISKLNDMIAEVLDDMNKENSSKEYVYKDLCLYLSRNF